ncbi:hypothetical protein VNO78_23189 [Psophocarpus tetragonolobus]|uniref:Uncharacterized protein n=1 Tax=Psophocarpus tetragonolobus TaxID=3891 RepID=A0AAN9S329_PSOTE
MGDRLEKVPTFNFSFEYDVELGNHSLKSFCNLENIGNCIKDSLDKSRNGRKESNLFKHGRDVPLNDLSGLGLSPLEKCDQEVQIANGLGQKTQLLSRSSKQEWRDSLIEVNKPIGHKHWSSLGYVN